MIILLIVSVIFKGWCLFAMWSPLPHPSVNCVIFVPSLVSLVPLCTNFSPWLGCCSAKFSRFPHEAFWALLLALSAPALPPTQHTVHISIIVLVSLKHCILFTECFTVHFHRVLLLDYYSSRAMFSVLHIVVSTWHVLSACLLNAWCLNWGAYRLLPEFNHQNQLSLLSDFKLLWYTFWLLP